MALPRHNTIEEDRSHFASERQQMLLTQAQFKIGVLSMGMTSISYLESMYQILLAGPYMVEHEKEALKFQEDIDKFRQDLALEIDRRQGEQVIDIIKTQTYKDLLRRFNVLVYELYKIKAVVGMG